MKTFALSLALASAQFVSASAIAGDGPMNLIEFASQPVIIKALYSNPSRLLTGVGEVAANGAVSGNATSAPLINIESQRWGADLAQAALVMKTDPQQGIGVMQYGLKHEQADGSFGAENGFQGISFFLEATARTLILLKQSGDPKYSALIAQCTPQLEKAARQFITSGNIKKQEDKGTTFTHRYYLLAALLGETAVVTQDQDLAARAEGYIKMGLKAQLPDGTNPEKGGFDVNYNAASGLFAERFYSISTNEALKASLKVMLQKALDREAKAVLPNGDLSIADSTRTGKDMKHDASGKPKGLDHKGVIQFFALGTAITGDPKYSALAQRIAVHRGWWD